MAKGQMGILDKGGWLLLDNGANIDSDVTNAKGGKVSLVQALLDAGDFYNAFSRRNKKRHWTILKKNAIKQKRNKP